MSRVDLSCVDGLRRPTAEEIRKIVRYYEHLYAKRIRMNKILSSVFIVLGIFCMYGYMSGGVAAIVIGVVCFGIALGLITGKNGVKKTLQTLRRGDYTVVSGRVYEIVTDVTGMPGVKDVRFISKGGVRLNNYLFEARLEQLAIGTPLLLICVGESSGKHEIVRVFTPFMLTEDGLKGTLF